MRTPWKFVADLVSGKPKVDASNDQTTGADETKAIEYHPASENSLQHVEIEAATDPLSSSGERAPADKETSTASLENSDAVAIEKSDAETQPVDRETAGPRIDKMDPTEATVVVKPARRKEIKHAVGTKVTEASVVTDPAEPTAPKPLIEEMAALDTDVEMLRRQLAEKLTEQNAQLRKMLGRFEPR